MKKLLQTITISTLTFLPVLTSAQTILAKDGGKLGKLMRNIIEFINTRVIIFLLGIGFLFFVWGMFKYFIVGGANDEERGKGRDLMIYATLGFVLILIFWGVVGLFANFTGLDGGTTKLDTNLPKAANI